MYFFKDGVVMITTDSTFNEWNDLIIINFMTMFEQVSDINSEVCG